MHPAETEGPRAGFGKWAQPAPQPMPGILGRTFAEDGAKPTPPSSVADMSRLMDALGGSSGLLAGSGSGSGVSSRPIATASARRRFAADARKPTRPLLQTGLLAPPNQGIDLNRYFGLLASSPFG
jgi:hypothetical protein